MGEAEIAGGQLARSDSRRRPDEMFDASAAERWPELRAPLAMCERVLVAVYERADRAAIRHHRQHWTLTLVAATCGTAAVLFAIIQLGYPVHFPWLPAAEVVAAVAAVTAVGLGIVASRRARWLLQRHQAERYRMLKFRFLIDPGLWSSSAIDSERENWLAQNANAIEGATTTSLHQWMEADEIPDPPTTESCVHVPSGARTSLAGYYREIRLAAQIEYFSRRAEENQRHDRPVRYLPAVFFFASVMAALLHFAGDLVTGEGRSHDWSVALIVLAAAFPVLGATARTLRMAHEHSRNTSRFRAKLVVLRRLSDALATETDPVTVFRELWCAEQVLESEHREWLRLMINGEWFG